MTGTRRWWRFNGVGLLGIGVQLAALWLFVRLGVPYQLATVVAVAAAVTHNFGWHHAWTWGDRQSSAPAFRSFARFALGNGMVSLVGNTALMPILVGGAGLPVLPANALTIGACGLVNFWVADRLVFGSRLL
jgi:putative flippase GtrA